MPRDLRNKYQEALKMLGADDPHRGFTISDTIQPIIWMDSAMSAVAPVTAQAFGVGIVDLADPAVGRNSMVAFGFTKDVCILGITLGPGATASPPVKFYASDAANGAGLAGLLAGSATAQTENSASISGDGSYTSTAFNQAGDLGLAPTTGYPMFPGNGGQMAVFGMNLYVEAGAYLVFHSTVAGAGSSFSVGLSWNEFPIADLGAQKMLTE